MAEMKSIEKQGIVTILGCDIKPVASLRRTLSADMSSRKWLSQNGFFSMKKIASSNTLAINGADSSSSSSESEEEYDEKRLGQDEIWRSTHFQKEENNNSMDQIPSRLDSWGSILSQKKDQDSSNNFPPPPVYVHPLVKRSASNLSQKSLEICTENLGSETGSDGLILISSDLPQKENNCPQNLSKSFGDSNANVVKYKTVSSRPLPPPISSIRDEDGNSLRMHCRRENGKLILEAVSVPSRSLFQASRHDGRLILTLINPPEKLPAASVVETAAVEEEVVAPAAKVEVQNSNPISEDKSGLMVKKFVGLRNKINPTWSNKFNKVVTMEEPPLPPLPPPPPSLPRVARLISTPPPPSASFNAYEYFWRNKTSYITTAQCISHKIIHSNGEKTYEHQELVLVSPPLRGCKEHRKSLSIWEPYCIATS